MKTKISEQEGVLTMREVSKMLGVSSRILRKYCNQGFVPGVTYSLVRRTRVFTNEQVGYLRQAHFLIRAGFTTEDLRKYVRLMRKGGVAANKERKAMLATHKRQVWQEFEELQKTIDFIERQEELL